MQGVRGKGNKTTEARLRAALISAGISGWRINDNDIMGTPDFFFPRELVAVFVDGCFWHGCPKCGHVPKINSDFWRTKISRNRSRDKQYNNLLRKEGVLVLRFWEHSLADSLAGCINKIRLTVLSRR